MITNEHKAKAIEIRDLIDSQPPEVIAALMDYCGFDGDVLYHNHIDEAIDDYLDKAGYKDHVEEPIEMELCAGLLLPPINIKITVIDGTDDYKHTWEFA